MGGCRVPIRVSTIPPVELTADAFEIFLQTVTFTANSSINDHDHDHAGAVVNVVLQGVASLTRRTSCGRL